MSTDHLIKHPFNAVCGECKYEWVLCWGPIKASLFCRFSKLPCPSCHSKKVDFKLS